MPFAVLTRDEADAKSYAAQLAPLGLDVVAMPVTRTAPPADPNALARALPAEAYAAILVASPRAAHELARAAQASALPALPEVWAVGLATKRALEIAKLPAQHPAGVRDGVELAKALVARRDLTGKRVLVPRAEDGRVEALEVLRNAGATVVDVVAYRTIAVAPDDPSLAHAADLLLTGRAAVCAMFAPSQVAALAAVVSARGSALADLATRFCAIGETTASAARNAGIREVAVASAPTPEGMAQAVRSVYPP
jgi:uroporphyrinogen-III synthase